MVVLPPHDEDETRGYVVIMAIRRKSFVRARRRMRQKHVVLHAKPKEDGREKRRCRPRTPPRGSDLDLRRDARWELITRNELKGIAVPHLIRALSDPSLSAAAAEILGSYSAIDATDALVFALKSPDQRTRRCAAAALSKMHEKHTYKTKYKEIQPLLDAALGSDPDIRRDAVRAMYRCRDPRAYEAFSANVTDPEVGGCAVAALGELRDPRAVPLLTQVLASPLATVAVSALSRIGNDAALTALLNCAGSSDAATRHSMDFVGKICLFDAEAATDFLVEEKAWTLLWAQPQQKLRVLGSPDRCRRVAEFIAKQFSEAKYPHLEEAAYEFLIAIVREQGAAIDDNTLKTIVGLQPPRSGWADEGYEEIQAAINRARTEAHRHLLDAANAELDRRQTASTIR